jgi:hypothetical protein
MRNFPLSAAKGEVAGTGRKDARLGRRAGDGAVATRTTAANITAGIKNAPCVFEGVEGARRKEFDLAIMQSPWQSCGHLGEDSQAKNLFYHA